MGAATLTLVGQVTGLAQGQQNVNVTFNLPNAVGEWVYPALDVGENVIEVPPGASTMLLVPPDSNAVGIVMKEVSGEVGCTLHPSVPSFRSLGSNVTSVILQIGNALSGPVSIAFW